MHSPLNPFNPSIRKLSRWDRPDSKMDKTQWLNYCGDSNWCKSHANFGYTVGRRCVSQKNKNIYILVPKIQRGQTMTKINLGLQPRPSFRSSCLANSGTQDLSQRQTHTKYIWGLNQQVAKSSSRNRGRTSKLHRFRAISGPFLERKNLKQKLKTT